MRRLPIITAGGGPSRAGLAAQAHAAEPRQRHPEWMKVRLPTSGVFFDLQKRVRELGLHTVCESASCPNIGECWSRQALTIMILGDVCTRSCQFCDVPSGRPLPPDPDEPDKVAALLAQLPLRHTVITCVDRDDLPDGGARHWARTIRAVKTLIPDMTLEVLTGDFQGRTDLVDVVLDAAPDVFAHNLETTPRLTRIVRVQARFERSLTVLAHAKARGAITKTGIMLGLGESEAELRETLALVRREAAVDILTLGQYLSPSRQHLPIARYATPAEFDGLAAYARELGFPHVEAGPLVRSSYHADGQADIITRLRNQALASSSGQLSQNS